MGGTLTKTHLMSLLLDVTSWDQLPPGVTRLFYIYPSEAEIPNEFVTSEASYDHYRLGEMYGGFGEASYDQL